MVQKMLQMVQKGGAPNPGDLAQLSEEETSDSEEERYDPGNGSPINSPSGDESMSCSDEESYNAPPYDGDTTDSEDVNYEDGFSPKSETLNYSPSFDGSNTYSDDESHENSGYVGRNGSGPSRNSRPKARFVATPGMGFFS